MSLRDALSDHHDQLLDKLKKEIELMGDVIEGAIADLTTAVTDTVTLVGTLNGKITDLENQLAAANNETGDAASIETQVAALNALQPPPVPEALVITAPAPITTPVNQPMTAVVLAATGGTAPYQWTATNLPAGITVDAAGNVTGTPTTQGSSTVGIQVTDSAATPQTASGSLDITVQ